MPKPDKDLNCAHLHCPLNVAGKCGPATIKQKYKDKVASIKNLPWHVRWTKGWRLWFRALSEYADDEENLMLRATLKSAFFDQILESLRK